jgi:hypothetical protein
MQRAPAEEITRSLVTTSAKIRALAKAGYDRTEIAEQLGIRYQHVRNVLLDAGITAGLQRQVQAKSEPVIVDAAPAPREVIASEVLLRAGFQLIGEWKLYPDSAIKLDATVPTERGVYAFVVDDVVMYVGLTNSSLKTRFEQ